ncbi:MAG: hypothetical protein RSC24_06265 [Clostridium sp.]
MDRSELYMLNTYKRHELEKRLKPVVCWEEIKKGELIWNSNSDSIYGFDIFEGLNPTDKNIIMYKNREGKMYDRDKSNWYFYDENISDYVEDKWSPKLWHIIGVGSENAEDYAFMIACNELHLLSCWNKKMNDNLTFPKFMDEYEFNKLSKCEDFDIVIK